MTFIALQFANGNMLFVGTALSLLCCVFARCVEKRWVRFTSSVLVLVGALLVILAANPLPLWLYASWLVVLLTAHRLATSKNARSQTARYALGLLFLCSIGMCLWEVPYRLAPRIPPPPTRTLYVVGDSLSIGADTQEQNWPEVLGELAGWEVFNYSFGGAKVRTALSNAKRVEGEGALVILEIGGNDLLSNTDPAEFERDLEQMLSTVSGHGRTVVMLELPLPPFYNRFGAIQRGLASTYGAILVPKRYLSKVLGTPGATWDGLHFSHQGHALLARLLDGLVDGG